MGKLEGKTAIVTGANSGIGYATALHFLEEGAKVVVSGRREDALKEAFADVSGDFTTVTANQANLSDNKKLIETAVEKYGNIDIIFHNAGIGKFGPFTAVTEAMFDESFDVNVKGPYFLTQYAVPHLNEGASIIFNVTAAKDKAWAMMTAYLSSKGALLSLMKNLSAELAPQKIRVNAISPGFTQTPGITKTGLSEEQIQGMFEHFMPKMLLGRPAEPVDIARVVTFLASDEAAYITGEEIIADGGVTIS